MLRCRFYAIVPILWTVFLIGANATITTLGVDR